MMVRWVPGPRPVLEALTPLPVIGTVANLVSRSGHQAQIFMRLLSTIAALSTLLPATLCAAQEPPIAPSNLSRYVERPTLSPDDLAVISAYVDREAPRLVSDAPSEAVQGRARLIDDLTSPAGQISPIFRDEYSAILVPHLRDILIGEDTSSAVLAAQVAAMLGTDGAVKLLTKHVEARSESRNAVRLWAVGGLANLVASPNVSKTRAIRAMRTVELAARDEVSWPVHRRAILTLAAGLGNQRGQHGDQEAVRTAALELLGKATRNSLTAITEGRTELVNGLPVVTEAIQNMLLLTGGPDEQAQLLEVMVPVLAGGHDAILASWDKIRSDPRTLDAAARYLDESELLLATLTQTPSQGPQLSEALRSGKRSDLESASKRWSRYRNQPTS